jgi:cell division transport system ATP-binding protein
MIQFYHVHKRYPNGSEALKDINLQIEPGEFVFVTGPSGAGKTTLIRLMLMIEEMSEGEILVQGRNLRRLKRNAIPYLRRNVGVVFQDFKLIPTRSIFDNVALSLEILGIPYLEIKKRVMQMLDQVGLEKYANHYPRMLSGGEQQRVAIARALVNEPMLVIADEPTGNLDPDLALEIMNTFHELHKRGTTVIVATHDRFLLERFSARIVLLNRGFVIQDGT